MDFVDVSGRLRRYDASISRCIKQEMEELGLLYLNVVQKPLLDFMQVSNQGLGKISRC